VDRVCAGFRGDVDVRAAVVALRRVIHRGVHGNFLDGVQRRRGERLPDRCVNGGAGLDGAAGAEVFTGVQDEAILTNLAGGVPVEQVVRASAVQREAVAGIAISVGENSLIAQAGVRAGTPKEIRVNAGTENRQLGEAAGTQGRLFDREVINHVAIGGVRLVHQWGATDSDGHIYFSGLQRAVHSARAVALDENLRVNLGLETIARERDAIHAERKVGNAKRSVGIGRGSLFQAGGQAVDFNDGLVNDRAGAICDRATDGAEGLLRCRRRGQQKKKRNTSKDMQQDVLH
jgi:hypothetical protein